MLLCFYSEERGACCCCGGVGDVLVPVCCPQRLPLEVLRVSSLVVVVSREFVAKEFDVREFLHEAVLLKP